MLQLTKPAAAHIPPGSSSPGGMRGRSRRTDCSGAGGNGEALIPPLPARAGSMDKPGELRCLPGLESLTLPLYSPDNTGIKITRLHLQRDKSEVCLLCLSGQWDSSTNGAVWT